MKYVIGIPTCDRPQVLMECIEAIYRQSLLPECIYVVDNNSKPCDFLINTKLPAHPSIRYLVNGYDVKGPEQAHATCLAQIIENWPDIDVAVRWDDDLIADPRCMEHLISCFDFEFVSCAGGCYYREDSAIYLDGPFSGKPPPDDNWNHIQFFKWGNPMAISPVSLYSGFAYRVRKMQQCGGFCTAYSKLGYRGETDATLRLRNCWVEPRATALHKVASGGVRSIKNRAALEHADNELFESRMRTLGIANKPGKYGWVW